MKIGVVAGCISLLAFFPYVISIFKGLTKPNRVTWWIWSWVSILLFISYKESGANDSLWIPIVYAVTPFLTAMLSIKYGVGGWSKFDLICLIGSIVISLLWFFSGSAITALYLFLIIDFFGTLPTIRKTYHFPEQENRLGWAIMVVANFINFFAIERLTFSLLVYPLYMFLSGSIILGLTFKKKKQA
jgi:hypothetical protein